MEKALAVENLAQLEKSSFEGFSRIYFGAEICERKIPSLEQVKKARDFCFSHKLKFSLLTPFCTDAGIEKLQTILPVLSEEDELIINDFGVLTLSKNFKAKPVAGRLLNRQFRDPRIAGFKGKFPEELLEHLKKSHASMPSFRKLLSEFNVTRVELDNLLQGIGTNLTSTGFKASIYSPFVFVAATRLCIPANSGKISKRQEIGILPCSKECLGFKFKLSNNSFPKPLYIIGNALFFENNSLPQEKELVQKGIDRIVVNSILLE